MLITPRCRPSERATHKENFHFADLYNDGKWDRPENLVFYYGSIDEALDQADVTVTISTAGAFESWVRGIPVVLISDFGINDKLANPYFIGSGCFTSLDAFHNDQIPTVSSGWLAENGLNATATLDAAVDKVTELFDAQAARASTLPCLPTYFGATKNPVLFNSRLLRRPYEKKMWPLIRDIVKKILRRRPRT